MKPAFQSYPDQLRRERQGWLCSVILHAIMGSCALALVSGLRMPVQPDLFEWSVALVEPSTSQTKVETFAETNPEPEPALPKPQIAESKPEPPKPVTEPVQHKATQPKAVQQVVQHRETQQITTVNQTASTIVTQSLQQSETGKTIAQVPALESAQQETQPVTTNAAIVREVVVPFTTEQVVSEQATEPVVHHAEIDTVSESTAHTQQPVVEQTIAQTALAKPLPTTKADYGWLMKALLGRIDELKNYPHMARINHWEGKVILLAVIKNDGQILTIDVHESSGRSILDNDAMETLRRASPLKLDHPLGKPQVAILMPISYSLQ